MKNKYIAALLSCPLLLIPGAIGLHKFYLGRFGWGIIYLLFCWTFVPLIVSIFEFFWFISTEEAAFDAEYNYNFMVLQKQKQDAMVKIQAELG